jgi:hypothetical protein
MRELEDAMFAARRAGGITPNEAWAALALRRLILRRKMVSRALAIGEIAAEMGAQPSHARAALRGLEVRGWITRDMGGGRGQRTVYAFPDAIPNAEKPTQESGEYIGTEPPLEPTQKPGGYPPQKPTQNPSHQKGTKPPGNGTGKNPPENRPHIEEEDKPIENNPLSPPSHKVLREIAKTLAGKLQTAWGDTGADFTGSYYLAMIESQIGRYLYTAPHWTPARVEAIQTHTITTATWQHWKNWNGARNPRLIYGNPATYDSHIAAYEAAHPHSNGKPTTTDPTAALRSFIAQQAQQKGIPYAQQAAAYEAKTGKAAPPEIPA